MSSNNETQGETSRAVNSPPKCQTADQTLPYPSPPNSPPQTKSDNPKAGTVIEDGPHPSTNISSGGPTPPTSPPRDTSNVLPKEEKPAESKPRLQASTLKKLLGVEGWQCGCPKLKHYPCSRPIPEKKKAQIDSQIESMIALTRSSPNLEAELDKLAMLVHCHQHDAGYPKEDRIEVWTTAFSAEEDGDTRVVPVEKQIRKALGRLYTQCIGTTERGHRCKVQIGGQKVQNCTKTIDEIVKPEVFSDDADLDGLLKVLETNMYCHFHVNKQALKKVASWKSSILGIRKEAESELVPSIEVNDVEEVKSQDRRPNTRETETPSTEKSDKLVLQNRPLPTPRNSRSTSPRFDRDPSTFWPKAYDTTVFEILARSDRPTDYQSSYDLIRRELRRPLDPARKEQEDGYLYLYEVEGNKGFVKIGSTGRSVATRHQEWAFGCNREPKVLYPVGSGSATRVSNALRVEALCRAELDHRRIRIYCKACLKQHLEWFETSAAEATAVIKKWSQWMAADPYQPAQTRSGLKWLKQEVTRRARDIDRFMTDLSIAHVLPVG